jgi:adenylate kinase
MILLTGTPGTGKTAVASILGERLGWQVVHLNDLVGEEMVLGVEGDSRVVDLDLLGEAAMGRISDETCILEGHLSHLLGLEGIVVVLRTDPAELKGRLERKGFGPEKVRENLESEALDVCLVESMERYGEVYEVDTTDRTAEETAEAVEEIIKGKGEGYRPGGIDWAEGYF